VILYECDDSWSVMDEFNMIWACRMYGLFHGMKMMSLVWFWLGIRMRVGYEGWHEPHMHDKYLLDWWNMMLVWLGCNSMGL